MSDRLPWFRCFPSALLGALAGLDPDEGLTYVTVLLRIYETGHAVAETAKTLSRRTGLAERKVTAALDGLIKAGKISRLDDGRLDSTSTHGEIAWQRDRSRDQSNAGKASAAKRAARPSEEKNDASANPPASAKIEKTEENQRKSATADELPFNQLDKEEDTDQDKASPSPETRARESFGPGSFDGFWQAYPHKVGKDAARTSFDRVRKSGRVAYPALLEGLRRYVASKPVDRSWCNPATWLNQGRWADEPDPAGSQMGRPGARASPDRSLSPAARRALFLRDLSRGSNAPDDETDPSLDDDGPIIDHEGDGGPDRPLSRSAGGDPRQLPAQGHLRFAGAGRR